MTSQGKPSGPHDHPQEYSDPSISWPVVFLVISMLAVVVWQFSTLLDREEHFPSDRVDMAIRGDHVVVYNPTNELITIYQVSVLRLTGTYSWTDRNLRPRSSRRVNLKKLRKADGSKYDPSEDGECRIRLEYWRGDDKDEISRYCRGF